MIVRHSSDDLDGLYLADTCSSRRTGKGRDRDRGRGRYRQIDRTARQTHRRTGRPTDTHTEMQANTQYYIVLYSTT